MKSRPSRPSFPVPIGDSVALASDCQRGMNQGIFVPDGIDVAMRKYLDTCSPKRARAVIPSMFGISVGIRQLRPRCMVAAAINVLALLSGCATQQHVQQQSVRRPSEVQAQIVRLMPASVVDRQGWARDIYAAFAALDIEPTTNNLCATLAVAAQESSFVVNPVVPGLAKIARAEIDRRAEQHDVPKLLVRGALLLKSSNGKSYGDRIAAVRTEQDMSQIYEDLIGKVPLGARLFANSNPVHTVGPMQVSVSFAEQQAHDDPYPYPIESSIRHELFTRRGGVYFGIAHLLDYAAPYDRMIYRFADFNAGRYASRNAAFQNAVSVASGIALAADGALVRHDSSDIGATELAVRALARQLDLSDSQIHRALEQGDGIGFGQTSLYQRVLTRADQIARRTLPRAAIPQIDLKSPKITRKLTTEWYANRVDGRYQRCLAQAAADFKSGVHQ